MSMKPYLQEVNMAKIKKFEDLVSWTRARSLSKEIYAVTSAKPFLHDFGLKDQIRRAAISILSNIAEASSAEAIRSVCNSLLLQKDLVARFAHSDTWRSTR